MILTYQSSNGQTFDLKSSGLKTRYANYHDYAWYPQQREQQYGSRIFRFDKEPVTYETSISVGGSIEQRKETLNRLHEAFDSDIFSMHPGRIIHGEFYIECYITFSSTGYNNPYTENLINIFCPYPFWIKEHKFECLKHEDAADANQFLDFEYDFAYDYMSGSTGQIEVNNPGAGPANFKVIMYGPAVSPYIIVDGNEIGVSAILLAGEYIIIDSNDHTVIKTSNTGKKTNLYNSRTKGRSIFEKISAGHHSVIWPGTFGFDLYIFEERSEPKWS